MPVIHTSNSRHSSARELMVWDPLVRLIHWGLAIIIVLNGAIFDDDGVLHIWAGYFAVGLVVTRLIWGLIGAKHARFSAFPPNPAAALRHLVALLKGNKEIHLSHNPLGALMAYNIWLTVLILGASGYMMGTVQFFGIEWVEELHEIAFSWLVFSIVMHVGGVVFDGWRSGVPLVRAMFNGRKQVPENESMVE